MDAKYRQTLTELRSRLQAAEFDEPEKQELLARVLEDVDDILDEQTVTPPERHDSLLAGLTEFTERFEASHPKLASVMTGVANMLSNLGI